MIRSRSCARIWDLVATSCFTRNSWSLALSRVCWWRISCSPSDDDLLLPLALSSGFGGVTPVMATDTCGVVLVSVVVTVVVVQL